MPRFRNVTWEVRSAEDNPKAAANCHEATLAVLMDIRDELQTLNRLLGCPNFRDVPGILRQIRRNTVKRKRPPILKVKHGR